MHGDEPLAPDSGQAADFDLLPYPSMPFPYTQPAHIAAMARLYGLDPPAAESARVLELGCASGGNIIPLAFRFPEARFLGIDLTRRHIEDGRQRIAALGLANIELRQADLAQASFGDEAYDYIVCHGVFSWVTRPVQEAILRICAHHLAPSGIAVVSYNVLPGWHLRRIVRDICRYHAGSKGPPRERVARARSVLELMAQSAGETEPYGLLLRNEAKRLARLPGAYILGEFLAAENAPCHFREFAEDARRHGLGYVCEGDLPASVPEMLFPEAESRIRSLAGPDRLAGEQYKDFMTGRPFRRSLLARADALAGATPAPEPSRLRTLHFAAQIRSEAERARDGVSTFIDERGRAITTNDPAVQTALERLSRAFPATLSFAELVAPETKSEGSRPAEIEPRVYRALFKLAAAGQVSLSAAPLRAGRQDDPFPCIWPVARLEAASRQPWLTSLRHDSVPRPPIPASLLALIDGRNDLAALKAGVRAGLERGEIAPAELHAPAPGEEASAAPAIDRFIAGTLAFLARNALLAPPSQADARGNLARRASPR